MKICPFLLYVPKSYLGALNVTVSFSCRSATYSSRGPSEEIDKLPFRCLMFSLLEINVELIRCRTMKSLKLGRTKILFPENISAIFHESFLALLVTTTISIVASTNNVVYSSRKKKIRVKGRASNRDKKEKASSLNLRLGKLKRIIPSKRYNNFSNTWRKLVSHELLI